MLLFHFFFALFMTLSCYYFVICYRWVYCSPSFYHFLIIIIILAVTVDVNVFVLLIYVSNPLYYSSYANIFTLQRIYFILFSLNEYTFPNAASVLLVLQEETNLCIISFSHCNNRSDVGFCFLRAIVNFLTLPSHFNALVTNMGSVVWCFSFIPFRFFLFLSILSHHLLGILRKGKVVVFHCLLYSLFLALLSESLKYWSVMLYFMKLCPIGSPFWPFLCRSYSGLCLIRCCAPLHLSF